VAQDAGRTPPQPPRVLPLLVTDEVVVFPHMMVPLVVLREQDMAAMDEALVKYKSIGCVAAKPKRPPAPRDEVGPEDIFDVGTVSSVLKMVKVPDGTRRALIQGEKRFRVLRVLQRRPFMLAEIEVVEEEQPSGVEIDALVRSVRQLLQRCVELSPALTEEVLITAHNIEEPGKLADFAVSNIQTDVSTRQSVLATFNVKERLTKVTELLNSEVAVLELGQKIQSEARSQMDRAQREYFLRQQLEAIRKELGEVDEQSREIEELRKAIAESGMPDEAREQAEKELDRLSKMPTASAEYSVVRTYLDWLLRMPWNKSTEDIMDIERAAKILDEDHYNLQKVKDRILEYLSVLSLKGDMKGPILCFVGPPGTGKTSLGRSIARALGRKFVRMSLGGIRDEAEIRGHRRTYIGALPGRIIQGIANAGTNNPVFMLDEIDKVGADFRGDPSAALLEVLDPEQNFAFRDHYLDVDFDLSRVMFLTTANVLDTIPPALRDRMEVLHLPGYTEQEKIQIARRYLIPRQLAEHGLERKHLHITQSALSAIIRQYTREAGLRNLEREIAAICRKRARALAEGNKKRVVVHKDDLQEYLGPRKFFEESIVRTQVPGVATGLAWTSSGGDVLFVEASCNEGRPSLILTGQLGDVMKESAQAAVTCIRSRARELGIDPNVFDKLTIHIHVPQGAIPKDGPSGGITMATALASALTGRLVRHDVAMTGEITLQGRVLPVGGIKEKVLAAARHGIRTVILPKRNEVDISEVPEEVRKKIQFRYVESIDEVLELALHKRRRKKRAA